MKSEVGNKKTQMLKGLTFVIFLLLFGGCEDGLKKKVSGLWMINKISCVGVDIRSYLFSNGIYLKSNGECELPIFREEDNHTILEKGNWEIIKEENGNYIKINSHNHLFNRKFEINKIWETSSSTTGHLLNMKLRDDSLLVECQK